MMRKLALLAALVVAAGCGQQPGTAGEAGNGAPAGIRGEISVVGSTTVQPLAEVLAEAFETLNPGVTIIVSGGGSSVGVKSGADGTAHIGMCSRHVKESEFQESPNIMVHTVANDGIAIVVEPSVPVDGLTLLQCRDIFSGVITNWNEVGGPAMPIIVVSREEGSGTRGAFEELVLGDALMAESAILQPSNGAVRTTCSTTPGAVAYLSFGYLDSSVKTVAVDGALPTPENVAAGTYPVYRPLNMITDGQPGGIAGAWLEFILSDEGQAIVVAEHYLPVN